MKYLVGIDEGSTDCTTSVFDETGKLISIKGREYSSYYRNPGRVEQNIEEAQQLGLPISCKVCSGGLDTNCCLNGAGAKDAGTQVLVKGTVGVSIVVTDKMVLDSNKRITVRSNPGFGN